MKQLNRHNDVYNSNANKLQLPDKMKQLNRRNNVYNSSAIALQLPD